MPKIDEAILRYDVYEGQEYKGISDIELPSFSPDTIEVYGSGIMGSYDAVLMGMISAMEMKMDFRASTTDTTSLTSPDNHNLTLYVAVQQADGSTRAQNTAGVRYNVVGKPKSVSEGKLSKGSTQGASVTYSLSYFAKYVDGQKVVEVDVLNSIFIWNGKDYFAGVRTALGL